MTENIIRIPDDLKNYKPIPFWSWNGKLNKEKLIHQIDWMNQNGIGGFFMHARSGLKTPYLSDEWMECVEACAEYARKLNMEAWIYDENGWPSGFAGGKLLEDKSNCDCYLEKSIGQFDSNASVSYLLTPDKLIRSENGETDGEYLNIYIKRSISTADILNKEVVDEFINLTHQAYKNRFGKDFPKKIKGFFTDEPQYNRIKTSFATQLHTYFKENYNEDVLDGLGLLFAEKSGHRAFRYKYWKAMQSLMLNNFTKNIYKWCQNNSIGFTGHYLLEDTLFGQMVSCGGVMPHYAYMTMPGIDWLGSQNVSLITSRQLASVAAQFSKEHTITESFACCGWQISPKDLKRVYDSQAFAGVGTLCHHLVPYTEYGQRMKDYPAHYSDFNPWVKEEFKSFNDYSTRLNYIISKSKEFVNVAVLHPIRSAYGEFYREDDDSLKEMDNQLKNDCLLLSENGIAFHFIDETLLREYGFVKNGRIGCKNCSYDFLILPHISDMDDSTEALIRKYLNDNGKILVLGENPVFKEGTEYDYTYIKSNCNINEIKKAQPFTLSVKEPEFYVQYRTIDNTPFITVFNMSRTHKLKNTFIFDNKNIKAFITLDLLNLNRTKISLDVELNPGESAVLFPTEKLPDRQPGLQEYKFKLNEAQVNYESNYLTVDYARYSEDGINYSDPLPIPGLFSMLLEKRYKGKIYFKWEFNVNEVPKKIHVMAQVDNYEKHWLNANEIKFTDRYKNEEYLITVNISELVHTGVNEYVTCTDWYQSEDVYYALFGENVSEGLKNCILYNSELENIYLTGDFGVYTNRDFSIANPPEFVRTRDFYIGKAPEIIKDEPVFEGLPFFAGKLELTQKVQFDKTGILLKLCGSWSVAYITVNGKYAGKMLFEREIDISRFARIGENTIKIDLIVSNYNLLGPHHAKGRIGNTGGISMVVRFVRYMERLYKRYV